MVSFVVLWFVQLFAVYSTFFGAGVVIRIKYAFVEYIILVYSLLINVGHYEFSTVARAWYLARTGRWLYTNIWATRGHIFITRRERAQLIR